MLLRYEIAKARCYRNGAPRSLSAAEFESGILQGKGDALFHDSLHVKAGASPPIVADASDDEFFRAVIKKEDGLLDMEPERLGAVRQYVLEGGPLCPIVKPPGPATARSSR
jgi:hypothetical protein